MTTLGTIITAIVGILLSMLFLAIGVVFLASPVIGLMWLAGSKARKQHKKRVQEQMVDAAFDYKNKYRS